MLCECVSVSVALTCTLYSSQTAVVWDVQSGEVKQQFSLHKGEYIHVCTIYMYIVHVHVRWGADSTRVFWVLDGGLCNVHTCSIIYECK